MTEIINDINIELDEESIKDFVRFAYKKLNISDKYSLSISFADRDKMLSYNRQYMNHDYATDVLSFPMDYFSDFCCNEDCEEPSFDDQEKMLGEIILCPEVIYERDEYDKTVATDNFMKIILLISHAILHLIGYDHDTEEKEKEMFSLQNKIVFDWKAGKSE